jgi:hypothetical protein
VEDFPLARYTKVSRVKRTVELGIIDSHCTCLSTEDVDRESCTDERGYSEWDRQECT